MEKTTVTVTPEMLDDMKIAVASFMSVQIILSGFCLAWLCIFPQTFLVWIIVPVIVVSYSLASFWIVCNMWVHFKTKLALLN